jgi:hypothetical protein
MADFYMPVTQEIYLAKNLIRTVFQTFPTGLAVSCVYIDKPGEYVVSEFHILLF